MAIVLTEQLQYEYGKFYFKDKNGKLLKEIVPEGTSITNKLVNEQQLNSKTVATVVDELPAPSELTVNLVYIAPSEHTETGDIYSEYVTVYKNGAYSWEKMGTPINVMGASGNNHRSGLVPDTPSTAGTTKFLREDGTWEAPPAAPVTSVNGQTGAVVLSIPDVSNKEDKVTLEAVSGATLTAQVDKYYTMSNVGTIAITLPTIAAGNTTVQTITFYMSAGSTPAVTFTSTHNVYYADGFEIAADNTYEVSAAYNGMAWVITSVQIVIPSA